MLHMCIGAEEGLIKCITFFIFRINLNVGVECVWMMV